MVKSKVSGGRSAEVGFPKLMIADDGEIVLFSSKSKGVTVFDGGQGGNKVGTYFDNWSYSFFKDFAGSITLSNEG